MLVDGTVDDHRGEYAAPAGGPGGPIRCVPCRAVSLADVPVRTVVRITLTVVCVLVGLYLLWLIRKPLSWIFIAAFLAVALAPPVNLLSRYMRRGLAIAVVYLSLLGVVVLLTALLVPPIVNGANDLADNSPRYVDDVREYVQKNKRLREINADYQITEKLSQEAEKLPTRLGDAAGVLRDIGFGIVNGLFAFVTIMVLAAFMLGSGPRWREALLSLQPPQRAARMRSLLNRMAGAVSGYVAGALIIALVAGISSFTVLSILGVPFAAPLAVVAGLFSLIPVVGATIAAVLIGVVTLFNDFPSDTIIWAIWAIAYQQVENHVIQPQIQKRTVNVHPFMTIVAVLFGATLLGVLGALVAIPVAASIQILVREWVDLRTLTIKPEPPDAPEPPADGPGAPPPGAPPPGAPPDPAPA